jgi:excisionase family DNA binding protein
MSIIKSKRGRPKAKSSANIKSDYLTVSELSKVLKISTSHIYTMTSTKKIPYIKLLGKKILFDKNEINNWLKSKRVSAK